MAFVGTVSGSSLTSSFGGSVTLTGALVGGPSGLRLNSNIAQTMHVTGAMYVTGSLTTETQTFTQNSRNAPAGLSSFGKKISGGNNYSDLYLGNIDPGNIPLWTFSVRGDSSFLFFGYNGAFTNAFRLLMGGGTCIGSVAASMLGGTPSSTTTHISDNVALGGFGFISPNARLHIGNTDGTIPPLRINSSSLVASPGSGSIEFDATSLYVTSGTTRQTILTTMTKLASASSDTLTYITGTKSSKGTSVRGTTVVAGDFVVSGSLFGAPGSVGSNTQLNLISNKLTISTGTLSGQGSSGGNDAIIYVSGTIGGKGTSGVSVFSGDTVLSGAMYLGTVAESMGLTSSIGAGTSTFDLSQQSIFYLSGTTSDFTANFTNVPTFSGRVVSVNLLVTQSSSAYKPTAVQIGGVDQSLLWANGVTPTANANKQDIFGFSLIRSGTNWAVLGQMSTYG